MVEWNRAATIAVASHFGKSKFENWHPMMKSKKGMSIDEYFETQEKPVATEGSLSIAEQLERIKAYRKRRKWEELNE